jgi:hypothetical protein
MQVNCTTVTTSSASFTQLLSYENGDWGLADFETVAVEGNLKVFMLKDYQINRAIEWY